MAFPGCNLSIAREGHFVTDISLFIAHRFEWFEGNSDGFISPDRQNLFNSHRPMRWLMKEVTVPEERGNNA